MTQIGPADDSNGYLGPSGAQMKPDITSTAGRPDANAAGAAGIRDANAGQDQSVAGEGGARSQDEVRPTLRQRVEAILIVVDEPVAPEELARVLAQSVLDVADTLASLRAQYLADDRGFELRDVAGGWRLYSAPECATDVELFVLEGTQARLTHAALETLAVVAYRQPVSRQSIAAIRGVSVDSVVRTLTTRGLIAQTTVGDAGASRYVTTPYFLSRLGLKSLSELPSLAPYLPENLDEFEEAF